MSKSKKEKNSEKLEPPVNQEGVSTEQIESNPIGIVLRLFLRSIDDYRDAVNIAMPAVIKARDEKIKNTVQVLEKYKPTPVGEGKTEFTIKGPHNIRELLEAINDVERLKDSRLVLSVVKSLFIGIFSEYDSFIGQLLKAIYYRKPVLFKSLKREITLTELLDFENLDAIKQDILEKEIEAFRRESYVAQFAELEKKFEFTTLRDFPEWPKFIEMAQRRNLMTHNDGYVSDQYLMICKREGFVFEKPIKVGDKLDLSPDYMRNTLLTVSKVGFMLAHTLWRKVLPEDTPIADNAMNDEIYDLLFRERWITASEFGTFGLSRQMCNKADEINRRIRLINTAIAFCRNRQKEKAIKLLDSEDWTACIGEFKLANDVLREDYASAIKVMKSIGKKGRLVSQVAYHTWPLFQEFRKQPEFHVAYGQIYGVPFLAKTTKDAQMQARKLGKPATNMGVVKKAPKKKNSKIKDGLIKKEKK